MKDVYQTSMTDLYSTTSFGGGGSSRSSSRSNSVGNYWGVSSVNHYNDRGLTRNERRVATAATAVGAATAPGRVAQATLAGLSGWIGTGGGK